MIKSRVNHMIYDLLIMTKTRTIRQ